MRGFTAEVMAYNYFEEKAQSGDQVPDSHHNLIQDFGKDLPERVDGNVTEPIYEETLNFEWSPEERREARKKAEEVADGLSEVQELKQEGEVERANSKLREMFGTDTKHE